MKNSEYWRNLAEHHAKRKSWKDRKVDKGVDIPPPVNRSKQSTSAYLQFLDTGIVSKRVLRQCPAWHEDMLVYPTTRALMKMAKGDE